MEEQVDERVLEEIEALEAILMDDVSVKKSTGGTPYLVEADVFPATADDTDQQYVRVTLEVKLNPGYPDNPPEVLLRNPRGLDDERLRVIMEQIEEKCQSCCGDPILYDLIELVREHLTSSNLPACPCTICLYGFSDGDHFIKTTCYHYYHAYCLAEHATKTEKFFREEQEKLPQFQRSQTFEVLCPICREPIKCDVETLSKAPLPLAVQSASIMEPDAKLRELQDYMSALYIQQKEKGGIIDPDAADSKVLLVNEPYYVVIKSSQTVVGSSTSNSNHLYGGGESCTNTEGAPPEEETTTPRWRQRQLEQQERQRQRAMQQRDGRPVQQPKSSKPPKPAKANDDDEEGEGEPQRSIGRQRRGRGRGQKINHRNR
ncbi:E3 ubiquitin-protein ligase RNF25 isoform X1 [Frankliniella occidentalis]|uniref:E3 ubiquitin-protein ligase RNF25 isoform X1 n=1 Tax=Frankliniella occidentalis TaxID=133901 RepID=A0A9C6U0G2_FRAOC|nr:E3 ubiquitin-protein ligase RNF25 isoform X1 [Frankliniella occidentalis]